MLNMGQNLGITTWRDRSRFGLSLTLGGGEVTMIDMAVAYGTLANLGHRIDLNPVLKIQNPKSKIQNSNFKIDKQYNHLVLDPRVAFILNNILADSEARIPAFGRHSKLNIDGHTVAVKTGTSNNLRDNWTIGYTPDYLVAVWVGNFNNSPMSRIASGITGATPIWQEIMIYLLNQYKSQNLGQLEIVNSHNFPWPIPKGIVKTPICLYTSTLPCTGCPTREEYFIDGTQPTHHCSPSWFISPTPSP
jgi:membrane carboxypeptidase/penicillin-binding protein PbpC